MHKAQISLNQGGNAAWEILKFEVLENLISSILGKLRGLMKITMPRFNTTYCKILIISPGLTFLQKAFLLGLFLGELIFGGNFAFQNGLGLTIKTVTLTVHGLKFRRAYYRKDICI